MSALYGDQFYQTIREGSVRSAAAVVPLVVDLVHPASVVDVGCGTGAWLAGFQQCGVRQVLGLEFSAIGAHLADIDPSRIRRVDVSRPFHLGRTFDLAMSLEVAEHLPEESAAGFVESLAGLGPVVLFPPRSRARAAPGTSTNSGPVIGSATSPTTDLRWWIACATASGTIRASNGGIARTCCCSSPGSIARAILR